MPLLSARRAAALHSQTASGALRVALNDALQRLPPRPILLDACSTHLLNHGGGKTDEALCVRAFLKLRQALLEGAPRSPELQLLWRHTVASAHYAAPIALLLPLEARDTVLGALLHQAGEMRVLAAITRAETGCAEKFDDATRAELRAQHRQVALQRLLSAWSITSGAAAAAHEWRVAANAARPATAAAVVRAAHTLGLRHALPQHAPPGLEEAAMAELELDTPLLEAAEQNAAALTRLLERVG